MIFRRKKNRAETLTDADMAEGIQSSEVQKDISRTELMKARETVSVLNQIRMENHIVKDLREVLGGH